MARSLLLSLHPREYTHGSPGPDRAALCAVPVPCTPEGLECAGPWAPPFLLSSRGRTGPGHKEWAGSAGVRAGLQDLPWPWKKAA